MDPAHGVSMQAGNSTLHNDAYNALLGLGLSSNEALERLEKVMAQNPELKDLPTIIQAVFGRN